MANCNNCGAAPSIHHNGCDYCGTGVTVNAKANKHVPQIRKKYVFDKRDWGYYDSPTAQWLTRCGHSVESVEYFIEWHGEDAPVVWQNQTGLDWPRRVR